MYYIAFHIFVKSYKNTVCLHSLLPRRLQPDRARIQAALELECFLECATASVSRRQSLAPPASLLLCLPEAP